MLSVSGVGSAASLVPLQESTSPSPPTSPTPSLPAPPPSALPSPAHPSPSNSTPSNQLDISTLAISVAPLAVPPPLPTAPPPTVSALSADPTPASHFDRPPCNRCCIAHQVCDLAGPPCGRCTGFLNTKQCVYEPGKTRCAWCLRRKYVCDGKTPCGKCLSLKENHQKTKCRYTLYPEEEMEERRKKRRERYRERKEERESEGL